MAKSANPWNYGIVILICLATTTLLAIEPLKWLGWILLALAALLNFVHNRLAAPFNRNLLVIIAMVALLGIIPINTTITYAHMLGMGAALAATILIPYALSRRWLQGNPITLPFSLGRRWYTKEIGYIALAAVGSYLIMPYYLGTTGSYLNWSVALDPGHIVRLFIGTNALGIWDELFFVGVCLSLLRQYIPFWWANLAQAVMWTSFLYELGFRGWGPLLIFPFALSQGYVFKTTKSLLYIITVHLTIDFMLFLVLIHLHHPEHLRIFLTSPF
ncbi:MAG TPA: CPBP family intramembrane glutamic endopeptidase [Candidatus Pristimantibacillus sp.]|nr:CPBP family intramembrane glutamic endopeptidase [Candidatus Pristimantibacillus sp.]